MAQLYRQHVLNEQPGEALVQLSPLPKAKVAAAAADETREEVGSFGD